MSLASLGLGAPLPVGFGEKIWRINWGLVLVLSAIAGVGVVALYSAAGGRFEPWAVRHAMRYGMALGLALIVALIHPKVWLALAWPIYVASMLMLVAVDIAGKIGMGAQRWLVIGPMQIQPSETREAPCQHAPASPPLVSTLQPSASASQHASGL